MSSPFSGSKAPSAKRIGGAAVVIAQQGREAGGGGPRVLPIKGELPAQVVHSTDRTLGSLVEVGSGLTARASAGDCSFGATTAAPPVRFAPGALLPQTPLFSGAMVRRVQRLVSGPGPAVGSGIRWARGTTTRRVGARFVALFASAHAPNDSVEADRARGHNSPPDGEGRLFSGPLDTCAGWRPLKGEDNENDDVIGVQGHSGAPSA